MYLSLLEIFDLFIRFSTIGQLSILSIYALSKGCNLKTVLASAVAVCICSYILLTTPIPDQYYGVIRGVLLLFTEILPYILWCFALVLLKDEFSPGNWPQWIKVSLVLTLFWFTYFFGYLQGRGLFHQINHVIQLLPLFHIIYIAIKGLADDLVNSRRKIRIIFIISICIYFFGILLLELAGSSLKYSSAFSAINASLVLLSTSVFSWVYFNESLEEGVALINKAEEVENKKETASKAVIPLIYRNNHQELCQLMQDGFYTEAQLTIKVLASKLSMPEHQLRELINKHLDFRNFSDFLNSYRLPNACAQLSDVANIRKPILTIALELGYGSIATFNRAFKLKTGKTPKEYRSDFQK